MSLGISIVGGQTVIKRLKNGEELKGIFIKQVLEDSPAGKTNALKTGDKILEVNDVKILFSFETCFKTVIFNQKSSLHCWVYVCTIGVFSSHALVCMLFA